MTNNEARIRELNYCRKLLVEEERRVRGTASGTNVYGIRRAAQILMERKKGIRAEIEAARASCQPKERAQ